MQDVVFLYSCLLVSQTYLQRQEDHLSYHVAQALRIQMHLHTSPYVSLVIFCYRASHHHLKYLSKPARWCRRRICQSLIRHTVSGSQFRISPLISLESLYYSHPEVHDTIKDSKLIVGEADRGLMPGDSLWMEPLIPDCSLRPAKPSSVRVDLHLLEFQLQGLGPETVAVDEAHRLGQWRKYLR